MAQDAAVAERTPAEKKQFKEAGVKTFLGSRTNGAYLEIGLGGAPKMERLQILSDNRMKYVGVDFASVCEAHERAIRKAGLGDMIDSGAISFRGNATGTYNYSLLKLLRQGMQFDLIYLDGHHTLQTDLPAAILATTMLKPDGLFAVDDIYWSLKKVARLMHDDFKTWMFYKDAYELHRYEPEEIADNGMRAIVFDILIPHFGYREVEALSRPGWAVLERAATGRGVDAQASA
jgi:hypothetical protein